MRTIKFRGKESKNGRWIYWDCFGNLISLVSFKLGKEIPVKYDILEETVGQFTGLYDSTKWEDLSEEEKQDFYVKNRSDDGCTIKYKTQEEVKHLWQGKEIYEGDIVEWCDYKMLIEFGEIICEGIGFKWSPISHDRVESITGFIDEYEIIGNIHDNKEENK